MFAQPAVKLFDIFRGVRKIIGQIHFTGLGAAKPLDRKLYSILVILNARLNFNNVIAIKERRERVYVIPKARLNRSASIAELQPQKRLSFTGRSQLFFGNEKKRRVRRYSARLVNIR